MSWVFGLIIALLVVNLLTLFLVFYYVNRNWTKLIDHTNHLNNIDRQIWRNTENLADMYRKIEK